MNYRLKISAGLLLLFSLFLASCSEKSRGVKFTPEETAVQFVKEIRTGGFTINDNSVEAIQTTTVNDMVLVLVQYSGKNIEGGVETCEVALEIEKSRINGWKAKNSAGLCHKVNDPTNSVPITVVGSWGNTTFLKQDYSTTFGFIRDSQITKIVITWEDDQVQRAEIHENTYLVAREGRFNMEKIEAFNDQNEIIFTNDLSQGNKEK
jgi:hypothetical protein